MQFLQRNSFKTSEQELCIASFPFHCSTIIFVYQCNTALFQASASLKQTIVTAVYRMAQKSKPLPKDQKIVLKRIQALK